MLSVIFAIALMHTDAEPATAGAKAVVARQDSIPGEPPYGLNQGRHTTKSKQICFRDPVIGSKIPTRRCMSREAFVQRQQDAKDHLDAVQRDARSAVGF